MLTLLHDIRRYRKMNYLYEDTLSQAINALEREQTELVVMNITVGDLIYSRHLVRDIVVRTFEVKVFALVNVKAIRLPRGGTTYTPYHFDDLEKAVEFMVK